MTNLYQIPQQSHERKVRTVGEKKNLSPIFPERSAFALSRKHRNSPFPPPPQILGGSLCLEPAGTFPHPTPPHRANLITSFQPTFTILLQPNPLSPYHLQSPHYIVFSFSWHFLLPKLYHCHLLASCPTRQRLHRGKMMNGF